MFMVNDMDKKFKVLFCATALLINSGVGAAIISGAVTTDSGAVVNLSGLEWMSFDHQDSTGDYTSLNVLWDTYDDAGTIWDLNGWRLATQTEVTSLYNSLSLTSGEAAGNADGVAFLHDNFGFDPVAATSFYGPDYGINYSIDYGAYNWAIGVFLSDTAGTYGSLETKSAYYNEYIDHDPNDSTDYTQYSGGHDPLSQFVLSSFSTSTSDRGDQWGAFFVREETIAPVPVPPSLVLMASGLAAGLGIARRKEKQA